MKKIYTSLCGTAPDPSNCPVVEISNNQITIGEKGNLAKLKKAEWNKLVELIRTGKLNKA